MTTTKPFEVGEYVRIQYRSQCAYHWTRSYGMNPSLAYKVHWVDDEEDVWICTATGRDVCLSTHQIERTHK